LPIAELCSLRWDQWKGKKLHGVGKKARDIELSEEAQELLTRWRKLNSGKHLFPGFNRHGITTEKMTARGVELYFRQLAKTAGFRNLKPKTLRHFAVTEWLRADMPESEIQRRLGVHKNYGFHVYRKFLESRA
jgi:integrase